MELTRLINTNESVMSVLRVKFVPRLLETPRFIRSLSDMKGYKGNRQSWNKKESEERHKGSFDLDELKRSDAYQTRIDQGPSAVKRKYAVCFGYLGSAYQGLQINPGCKSVEAELEKALFLAGGIEESNFGFMGKTQWTRAARTDRGVHAATQCCSMKLQFPLADRSLFVDQVNRFLPQDIRVHMLTKVSKGFNSKGECSKRRYNYLLPTYMLASGAETKAVLAAQFAKQGPVTGAGYEGGYLDPALSVALTGDSLKACRGSLAGHRATAEQLTTLREALKQYEGTNFFHNFTSGKSAADASSQRYNMSFTASEPFVSAGGLEWVVLSVLGQSFLLNQIRKMVGLACEITRGEAPADTISRALNKDVRMDIPMAPGLGLYLKEIFFDRYNIKMGHCTNNDARVAAKRAAEAAEAALSPGEAQEAAGVLEADSGEAGGGDERAAKRAKTEEAPAGVGKGGEVAEDDEAGGAGGVDREVIDWCEDENKARVIAHYCENSIHPHIMDEEEHQLHYLYYLDYLRIFTHYYRNKGPSTDTDKTSANDQVAWEE